jgi:hypothetical protein
VKRTVDTIKNVDCFSRNATCCEDVNNLFCCVLSRHVKCDRKMRFQIFFLQNYFCKFVFVIEFDHLIVYVSICLIRIFSRWRMFYENDSSNSTKAIHKSDISSNLMNKISSNLTNDISSNLTNDISLNLTHDISSNLTNDISSNLINDISSNSTKILFVLLNERFWMTNESM